MHLEYLVRTGERSEHDIWEYKGAEAIDNGT